MKQKKEKRVKKGKRIATLEEKKIVRWVVDNKEDWRKEEKIKVDYRKIEENVKDVRKFLDLANYYRRFIKDFA